MSFRLIIFQCIELIAQSTTQLQTQYITASSWQGFIADFHYIQAALWCLLVEDPSLSLLLNSYPHELSLALSSIASKYICVDRGLSSHDATPFLCVGWCHLSRRSSSGEGYLTALKFRSLCLRNARIWPETWRRHSNNCRSNACRLRVHIVLALCHCSCSESSVDCEG
jgi:hypothetical protein